MLKIKFEVSEDILSRIIISRSAMPTEFANYLWDKYNDSYRLLQKSVTSNEIDKDIVKEVQRQPFFSEELLQSKENCKRVEACWRANQQKINNYLNNIMRMDFSLNLTAYIVSPNVCVGINFGDNCFIWGHLNGLNNSNYDLVYLVHESLHSFFGYENIEHAIIENISDVELAKLLNKTKKGFKYHDFTKDEHIKIFPFWNLYLNKTKDEIKEEQALLNIQYDLESVEHYRENLSKMDIKEFIEFIKQKIITKNMNVSVLSIAKSAKNNFY